MNDVPRTCTTLNHSLSCKNEGFINARHNVFRDSAAELLSEVFMNVKFEPPLLKVTGEVLPDKANHTGGADEVDQIYAHYEKSKKQSYNAQIFMST